MRLSPGFNDCPIWFQSAPAIAGGRCTGWYDYWCKEMVFQSAPAIAGGRCIVAVGVHISSGVFQSAPAIAGGRCCAKPGIQVLHSCFNPRPPLLAGDAFRPVACQCSPFCFNPRPPLLAGDAEMITGTGGKKEVSIRARHCWRAMPATTPTHCHTNLFQSAPAIAGGRCCCQISARMVRSSFNPRPPLLAGDAYKDDVGIHRHEVSIRARHCWRAMPSRAVLAPH